MKSGRCCPLMSEQQRFILCLRSHLFAVIELKFEWRSFVIQIRPALVEFETRFALTRARDHVIAIWQQQFFFFAIRSCNDSISHNWKRDPDTTKLANRTSANRAKETQAVGYRECCISRGHHGSSSRFTR